MKIKIVKIASIISLLSLIPILFCSCKIETKMGEYEVIAVERYRKTETNAFGGIEDTYLCYTFQYLDGNEVKTRDCFTHANYGLQKVIVGESNKYTIQQQGFDKYEYLQLTEETIENMNKKGTK